MAITRSMSGATKKIEKVPKQKSKPKLKFSRNVPYTIESEASEVFMLKDVAKRYYEKHPLSGFMSLEAIEAGQAEWAKMTDAEKNVWIEYTKRRHDEGVDVWDILQECNKAYNNCN